MAKLKKYPDNYHPDDRAWIRAQLDSLPAASRERARVAYSVVFSEAHDSEPAAHKKENKARRAANIRLREFVSRVCSVT